jgi:hypothetical protein
MSYICNDYVQNHSEINFIWIPGARENQAVSTPSYHASFLSESPAVGLTSPTYDAN